VFAWLKVYQLASTIIFKEEEDTLIWQFSFNEVFSSEFLYKVIYFRGIQPVFVSAMWKIKVPPRVRYFLWLLSKNKVLTRDNLSKRREVEDASCLFCCEKESVFHLFFNCAVATQLWNILSDIFQIQLVCSFDLIGHIGSVIRRI
jgi:hypothetical protein